MPSTSPASSFKFIMYADQELVISFFGEERQTYGDIQ